ncbi:hypothetical protein [Paenibacillus sp. FSL R10-2734]|uniref:hypothetical protein n=1 Tax=Paenibacillus sp. FSL R10-2734 TaxID=2954691 RepID=UPI0030DAB502
MYNHGGFRSRNESLRSELLAAAAGDDSSMRRLMKTAFGKLNSTFKTLCKPKPIMNEAILIPKSDNCIKWTFLLTTTESHLPYRPEEGR